MRSKLQIFQILLCLMVSSMAHADIDQSIPAWKGLRDIRYSGKEGRVEIIGTTSNVIKIEAEKIRGGEDCPIEIRKNKTSFWIDAKKKAEAACEVNVILHVPKFLEYRIGMEYGDVRINNLQGKRRISIGAGSVQMNHVAGSLKVSMSAGSVVGSGSLENVNVSISHGKFSFVWQRPVQSGKVNLFMSGDEVLLKFPKGMTVNSADLEQNFARIQNEIDHEPSSLFKIGGKVKHGKVVLKQSR